MDLELIASAQDEEGFVSLADQAHASLLRQIRAGTLGPGAPLSVPALARELELSRSPVREAVQRLIHEGLATHVPHKGAHVVLSDATELSQVYAVKLPLEVLAAGLATPRFSNHDLEVVARLVHRQREELESGWDTAVLMDLDVRFHKYIRDVAGNPILSATVEQFTNRTSLATPSGWTDPSNARLSIEEHQAIVDAIAAGDAEGAEKATRRHIECLLNRLIRMRGAHRDARTPTPTRVHDPRTT